MPKAKALEKGPLLFAEIVHSDKIQQRKEAQERERIAREQKETEIQCERNRLKRLRQRKAQFMKNLVNCVFGIAGIVVLMLLILLFRLAI